MTLKADVKLFHLTLIPILAYCGALEAGKGGPSLFPLKPILSPHLYTTQGRLRQYGKLFKNIRNHLGR